MNNVYKLIKGIKNLTTLVRPDFIIGISDNGELTRTNGAELSRVGWTNELTEFDNTTPNLDGTPIHFQSTNLHSGYSRHIKQNYAYDDNSKRPLGVLNSIGGNMDLTTDDWKALDNRRVIITSQDGCWFNIANNGTELTTTKTKKIHTGTNQEVEKVIKAVFTYDYDRAYWNLESYELLEDWQRYLFKRFTFERESILADNVFELPNTGGLRFSGYYDINVFCEVEEKDASICLLYTSDAADE